MKFAIATAAALLAASSMSFAADKSGGKNDGKNDPTTTNSIKGNGLNQDGTSDDAQKCRDHTAGAALCRQDGTVMDQQ